MEGEESVWRLLRAEDGEVAGRIPVAEALACWDWEWACVCCCLLSRRRERRCEILTAGGVGTAGEAGMEGEGNEGGRMRGGGVGAGRAASAEPGDRVVRESWAGVRESREARDLDSIFCVGIGADGFHGVVNQGRGG